MDVYLHAYLVEENVFVVYMHNSILQCAFPPALGSSNLTKEIRSVMSRLVSERFTFGMIYLLLNEFYLVKLG